VPLFFQTGFGKTSAPIEVPFNSPLLAARARLDFYVSGHGLVGENVCDEFCKKKNTLAIDGEPVLEVEPWIECGEDACGKHIPAEKPFTCMKQTFDYKCEKNMTSCPASAILDRANWCPGYRTPPKSVMVPRNVFRGSHVFTYEVENLEGNWMTGATLVFMR
jgi:hypothetical protein